MRTFEEAEQHANQLIQRSNERYAAWLQRGGVEPNATLMLEHRATALQEAQEGYMQKLVEIQEHNIGVIRRQSERRIHAMKRRSATLRLKICLPLAFLFGLLAWYSFCFGGEFIVGLAALTSSLMFLTIVLLGTIFDRPSQERQSRATD